MGLDIDVSLVVGVPLLNMGTIKEESEEVDLFDSFGKATVRTATLKQTYFVAQNGDVSLIASNRRIIAKTWSKLDYSYHNLLDEKEEVGKWIHQSDYEGGPEQVIIGLHPDPFERDAIGRYETYRAARMNDVSNVIAEVREYLRRVFGYEGDVFVISQAIYSY